MPKKNDPESYEVSGTPYRLEDDEVALVHNVALGLKTELNTATRAVTVALQGSRLIVRCHAIERYLREKGNLEALHADCSKHVDQFMKRLKAEYRKRHRAALETSERKELRDYSFELISINEVYQFVCVRVYDLGLERVDPED